MPRSRPRAAAMARGPRRQAGSPGESQQGQTRKTRAGSRMRAQLCQSLSFENNAVIAHEGMVALVAGSSQPNNEPSSVRTSDVLVGLTLRLRHLPDIHAR